MLVKGEKLVKEGNGERLVIPVQKVKMDLLVLRASRDKLEKLDTQVLEVILV